MNNYTWEDVLQCLNEYNACNTRLKRTYDKNHVFDDDMSVKWNREVVEKENERIILENGFAREKKAELWKETVRLAVETIISDFKHANVTISKTGAERLFDRLYSKYDGDIELIEDTVDIFTSALSEYDI